MSYPVKNGQTSVVLRFKLLDSSSTVGAGLTGLTSGSASLIISTIADNEASATAYTQAGSTIETITTLGTFATPTATKCRFKELDSTNHKGVYEFQFADARFAVSSAKSLLISVLGATNLAQADFVVPLVSDDPYVTKLTAASIATGVWTDTTAGDFTTDLSIGKSVMNGVALGTGLTVNDITTKTGYSLSVTPPTAAAVATAVWTDTTASDFTTALSVGKSVMNGVALGTGLTVNDITTKTGYSLTQTFPTNFSSLGISVAGKINGVVLADTVTTYTGDTPQTGDAFARIGAAGAGLTALGDVRIANLDGTVTSRMATFVYTAPDNTDIAAIKVQTDKLTFTTTNEIDANVHSVNDVAVIGVGTLGNPWRP